MKRVVFICTGNIFRSMTAEYALRAALPADSGIRVESAGTLAPPQDIRPSLHQALLEKGIDASEHLQRRVTPAIILNADLVIAMGTDHQEYLHKYFKCSALLFNEACGREAEGVLDVHEAIPDWQKDPQLVVEYDRQMVEYLCEATRDLANNLPELLKNEQPD